MEKRIYIWYGVFVFLLMLLIGRLYYIQIFCGPTLSEVAVSQQQIPVIYPYSRGVIYDRNMEKLTNTTCAYYYLIAEEDCTSEFEERIGRIGGVQAGSKGETYRVYRVTDFQETINHLLHTEHGAYGFCVSQRYADQQTAVHLIGYLQEADGKGASGLEKWYEAQLGSDSPEFYLTGDGIGQVVHGAGLTRGGTEDAQPAGLVTTIDGSLQRHVEEVLQQEEVNGAVVVADTETGHILALASSPTYNPNRLQDYLNQDGSQLVNKALQQEYPSGPVLKLLKELTQGTSMTSLSLARDLGFGACVWEDFPNEAAGTLGETLSSLRVTPIQVCQMLTTLANQGEQKPLSLAMREAQGESVTCIQLPQTKWDALARVTTRLGQTPATGDGWAMGYDGRYGITVYAEGTKGSTAKAERVFSAICDSLED